MTRPKNPVLNKPKHQAGILRRIDRRWNDHPRRKGSRPFTIPWSGIPESISGAEEVMRRDQESERCETGPWRPSDPNTAMPWWSRWRARGRLCARDDGLLLGPRSSWRRPHQDPGAMAGPLIKSIGPAPRLRERRGAAQVRHPMHGNALPRRYVPLHRAE